MKLEDSKTIVNLEKAFAGESQAMVRYLFYAKLALDDGSPEVSKVFETFAVNEKEHAKMWFNLFRGIKTVEDALRDAIAGEHYETTTMYVEFAKTAEEEGFKDIAMLFKSVGTIEHGHEEKFKKLLNKEGDVEANWCCGKCGYVHSSKDSPGSCPVCQKFTVGGIN